MAAIGRKGWPPRNRVPWLGGAAYREEVDGALALIRQHFQQRFGAVDGWESGRYLRHGNGTLYRGRDDWQGSSVAWI